MILIILIVLLSLSLLACQNKEVSDTLVIGNGQMNGVFSPFFTETDNDEVVLKLTSMTLLRPDEMGRPQGYASKYVEPVEVLEADGSVSHTKYRFELQDGLTFSDGEPVTADDIIFSIKVLCDPGYNGLSMVGSLPIVGLQEYKYDTKDYKQEIQNLKEDAESVPKSFVDDYIMQMSIADCNAYPMEDIAVYLGYELDKELSAEDQLDILIQEYYEFELANSYDYYIEGAKLAYFEELEAEFIANQEDDISITEISGIERIDDKTVEITLEGVNPAAIWELGEVVVAPEHYYCENIDNGKYLKGNLDEIRAKNGAVLGAGPYIFEKFENNVVQLSANENYIFGKPEIPNIKIATSSSSNTIEAIKLSEIDIAEVAATEDAFNNAKDAGLETITTDFQGYGYIGINSGNVSDLNVRKGLMCLMNREPAVKTYFGGLAKVIERPVSYSSWAYPEDAQPVYNYDKDKALDYFKQAGYEQTEVDGNILLEKDGTPLNLIAGVGGEGTMDHPAALVFTQMKTDLESLGGSLEISDCDMTVLIEGLYQGSWDLWAASWQLGIDPDMSNRYMTGAEGNYYRISSTELDNIFTQAVSTGDIDLRKEYYKDAMKIIMEEAIELPLYQRQNLKVYNPQVIDKESMPENMSEFYGYLEDIHKIKLIEK